MGRRCSNAQSIMGMVVVPSTAPASEDRASAVPSIMSATEASAAVCPDDSIGATCCAHCHNFLCSPPPRPPPRARFSELPEDCLEVIARGVGSDLGRFAAVSKAMRSLASPSSTLWRKAYEEKHEDVDGCDLDVLSSTLMRACLLREAPPKAM